MLSSNFLAERTKPFTGASYYLGGVVLERLWTRPFIQMSLGMLFLFIGFYLLLPTLPLYIKLLGGSESQVGLTIGVFTLTAVVFRPLVGGLLDRYGRRPFIIWGLIFFTLSMYLYDWISIGGIALFIALRALHGASWAVSTTAIGTAVTDTIPVARRGEGMGWFGMAMTVAMAIGPMIGVSVIQEDYSFHYLFLLATGLSMVALLLTATAKTMFQPKTVTGRWSFFERTVLPISVVLFFLTVAYGGVMTFLPLFAESLHVNPGIFFFVFATALTVIRPIAGKLSDRHGEVYVIVPALLITGVALLVLSVSNGLSGIIVSAVLYGIGFGSAQPALQAATLRLAHPERKGVANASFFSAFDLGIGLGAMALGLVSQLLGYQALFAVSAVSVAISLLIFLSIRQTSIKTNRKGPRS